MGSGAVSPPKPPGRPTQPGLIRYGRIKRAGSGVCVCDGLSECGLLRRMIHGVVWMIAVHGLTPGLVGLGIIGNFEPIGRLGPVS